MKKLFKGRYRTSSIRLKNWDYGSNAAYFITICTENRKCFFGEIHDQIMQLNEAGWLAEKHWWEIPQQFPYVELGNFVVMPNHVHGVLVIRKSVEARLIAPLPPQQPIGGCCGHQNPMIHDNISRIIRWYKGKSTFFIRRFNPDFGWQSRFYDRIIRDVEAFERIQRYIIDNPKKWVGDKFHS